MSVQRYKLIDATSIKHIQNVVDPAASLGNYATSSEVDIVLADDTQLPVLTELMGLLGYAFVATAPAAADAVKSQVLVTDFTGLGTSPPVSAAGHARLYFDTTTGLLLISQNGSPYQSVSVNLAPFTQIIPTPCIITDSQTLRTLPGSNLMEGGAYRIERRSTVSTLNGRLSGASASGAIVRHAIYQVPGGLPVGTAQLLGTGTFTTSGIGGTNYTIALGSIVVEAGWLYLLNGQANTTLPSATSVVYDNLAIDLLSNNAVAGLAPVSYTTTISAVGAPPATFIPLTQATVTSLNTVPIIRLS
jgi:hypothetical protein